MKRWLLALVLTPSLLWSAYWGVVSFSMKQGLDAALNGQTLTGLTGQMQESRIHGFPADFRLDVKHLNLQQAGMFSAVIPQIQMEAAAHRPHLINIDLNSDHRITTSLGEAVIGADEFQIGIFFRPELLVPLNRILLNLEKASIIVPAQNVSLRIDQLKAIFFDDSNAQDNNIENLYRIGIEGTGIDMSEFLPDFPEPYRTLSDIRGDLKLIYSGPLNRYVVSTGFPRIETIILSNAQLSMGTSKLSLNGRISVGEQGALTGNITVDIHAWKDALDALTQAGVVQPDLAETLTEFLNTQAQGDKLSLPLKIEDNAVTFGMFTLGFIPMP